MLMRIVCLFLLLCGSAIAGKTQPLDKVIAVVNDRVITQNELNQQVAVLKSQIASKKMQLPLANVLRKQVLQHLIDVDIQLQIAERNGINIDNTDVDGAIKRIAKNNKVSVTQLRKEITKSGLSWPAYRDNIKKEMLLSRLQQKAVGKDIKISNEQVDQYIASNKKNIQAQLQYHIKNILIPLSDSPSSDELKKVKQKANEIHRKLLEGEDFSQMALAESSGEFALEGGDLGYRNLAALPDIFANTVVTMKPGQISRPLRADNGYHIIKLEKVKGNNKKHYVNLTKVRHILVKQDASMTQAEATRQVNNLYQQLRQGKNFSEMAKKYSLDPGSASKGGELGWVHPGELVPEFEKTMDKLRINQISKPVKSQFGWHIIQVEGRKRIDDSKTFEKQQVRQFLYQSKFREAVQNWQQQLRAEAFVKVMDKSIA